MKEAPLLSSDKIRSVLEFFAPKLSLHITPLRYMIIDPDRLLFIFRTNDSKGIFHYFACLQYRHLRDISDAEELLTEYGYKVHNFWPPNGSKVEEGKLALEKVSLSLFGFETLLCEIKSDKTIGYFGEEVLIMPGDNLISKIEKFSTDIQEKITSSIQRMVREPIDYTLPAGDAFLLKNKQTSTDIINPLVIPIIITVTKDGRVYVNQNNVGYYDSERFL